MSNFAKNIGEKRTPVTTPAHIVENGIAHYGTFSEPFQDLNLLDCKKPFFMKTPSFIKRMRLIEWEAFEVNMDEGSLISACYNMGPIGFSIFVWHNNADNKIYAWRNLVPVKRAKVAKQLLSDNCYCKTKKSEYKIINDFANGKAQCVGHTKGKSGEFAIDISFERLSPLANGVMPLMKNKDGSFRNPLYSEKDFFKATGTITLNGKTYKTKIYNLDAILSVGYRVNSKNATSFRCWANKILKEYLLRGYSINKRLNNIEQRINNDLPKHEQRIGQIEEKIDFFVRTALPPVEGIFFEGQIFDAYVFASNLIKSAQKTIVLIDNYIDENTLMILSKRNEKVEATVYTAKLTKQLQLDLQRHNAEYPAIAIHEYKQSHDRFLIIDSEVFHIGASLKDLGKKWFAFSKLHFSPQELIERMLTEIQK